MTNTYFLFHPSTLSSSALMPSTPAQRRIARELLPFLAWICGITVALAIRCGCYGNRNLVVGPNTSRMLKSSSVLVEEVRFKDDVGKGLVLVHGFTAPPELSLESNWTAVRNLDIGSYGRQGFSLWLNKGSKIWMTCVITYSISSSGNMYMIVIKGEHNLKESHTFHKEGFKEASYSVNEDDSYYIGIVNLNPHRMVTALKINVSSKVYDTKEATCICSMANGLCKLNLSFPNTKYFVLTTNDNLILSTWDIQISFIARLTAYILVVGFVVLLVHLILHQLEACESNMTEEDQVTVVSETEPILPRKEVSYTYNTNVEDPIPDLCCSSNDLYEKLCAICYDEYRSCFFTPCGHSITCGTCAKRIIEEENRVCPICRRLIHKVRQLVSASTKSWIQDKKTFLDGC